MRFTAGVKAICSPWLRGQLLRPLIHRRPPAPASGSGPESATGPEAGGASGSSGPVSASVVFAATPAGVKIHVVGADGLTLCGFSLIQLSLLHDPVPLASMCEWCLAA